jgi:hypothetical protein
MASSRALAEYAVIPAAGHASNLDNPTAFTATLLAFLDRVLPPDGAGPPPPPKRSEEQRRR